MSGKTEFQGAMGVVSERGAVYTLMSELFKQCTACLTGKSASVYYVILAQHCAIFIL